MESIAGQHIKGYELRERLGTGGFGAVYRAYQTTVGREVAIKVILPSVANHPDFIRRFETEAQIIARLEHLHIVPLYDYWRDPEGAYLVMRWLKGGSLRDALEESAYDLASASRLLDQIAAALDVAHANQVIHRDLKPANILLDEDGNAYLADFGIAKDLTSLQGNSTGADVIVGSLDYISPEQARSETVTSRTDIYSLGVVLYEILTGQHPFPNITSVERLYKHLNDLLPLIEDPAIPPAVNTVIQKATAKDPAQRYATTLEMAAAFHEAAALHHAASSSNPVEILTLREQEILHLVLKGCSNKEIAQRLTFTLGTVKWYLTQIYKKLGVRSRVQAMVRARELNLLTHYTAENPTVIAIPTEDFQPENPYKGLRAFRSADYQDFFGREKVIAKLIKQMSETGEFARFLAVIVPSGSGKSSLIRAGLIPALWRGELPGSEKWFVVEMLPGARPLDELEVALTRVAANQGGNIHEHLRRDPYGLLRIASLILPEDDSELLLVIDQFEEIFTLVEDEAQRSHFLDLLYAAVSAAHSRVRVVLTMRADFYDRPLHYPKFGEMLRTRLETIMPLSAEEMERTIVRPAQRVGVTFEAGLVSSIAADVNYEPGALPLLQYALTELFEQRQGRVLTHEAYQVIGRTVGALAKRADELYLNLDENGREAARQMFLRLVTLGEGTDDARRRVPRAELMAITSDPDIAEEILDTYTEYRLLSVDHDPVTRTPTVEVAHEALLREWERLRTWLNESRGEIRLQRQLAQAAAEWEKAGQEPSFLLRGSRLEIFETWSGETRLALTQQERDFLIASFDVRQKEQQQEQVRQARETLLEQRSRKFLRSLVGVFAAAAVIAVVLALFALNASARAESEQNRAERERERAQQRSAELTGQNLYLLARQEFDSHHPELALALAVEAYNSGDAPPQLRQLLSNMIDSPGVVRVFEGHSAPILDIEFMTGREDFLSASGRQNLTDAPVEDNTIRLWKRSTGEELRRFEGHTDAVIDISVSPNKKRVLSASYDGTFILWDIETGAMLNQIGVFPMIPLRVHFISNTTALFYSGEFSGTYSTMSRGSLTLRNVETGELIYTFDLDDPNRTVADWTVDRSNDFLVTLHPDISSEPLPTTFAFWDLSTGERLQTASLRGYLNSWLSNDKYLDMGKSVTFASDGASVFISLARSAELDTCDSRFEQCINYFYIWNVESAELTQVGILPSEFPYQYQAANGITNLIMRPLNSLFDNRVLVGSVGGELTVASYVYDMDAREPVHQLDAVGVPLLSRDGNMALIVSPDTVALFDPYLQEEYILFRQLGSEMANLTEIALFAGRFIVSGHEDGDIRLWERSGDFRNSSQVIGVGALGVTHIAYSPDGQTIVNGTGTDLARRNDGLIVSDLETGEVIWRPKGQHSRRIGTVEFSHNSDLVVSTSHDAVILWNVATEMIVHEWKDLPSPASNARFSPDDQLIYVSLGLFYESTPQDRPEPVEATVAILDAETGGLIETLALGEPFTSDGANGLAISPDGKRLAVGTPWNLVVIWDLERGEIIQSLIHPECRDSISGYDMEFTPDGTRLAVIYWRCGIALWDIPSRQIVKTFRADNFLNYMGVALSPDGTMIAATTGHGIQNHIDGFFENAAAVWDIESGRELYRFRGHGDLVWGVQFSPDGQRLATGAYDGTIRIWDLDDSGAAEYNWLLENRHVPTLTCEQWAAYGLPERCSPE